jgi:hypothetical protein
MLVRLAIQGAEIEPGRLFSMQIAHAQLLDACSVTMIQHVCKRHHSSKRQISVVLHPMGLNKREDPSDSIGCNAVEQLAVLAYDLVQFL